MLLKNRARDFKELLSLPNSFYNFLLSIWWIEIRTRKFSAKLSSWRYFLTNGVNFRLPFNTDNENWELRILGINFIRKVLLERRIQRQKQFEFLNTRFNQRALIKLNWKIILEFHFVVSTKICTTAESRTST